MSNDKKNSVSWYIIERHELEIKSRYGEIKPDQYGKQLIALEKKAEEMYQDEIDQSYRDGFEFALINECAKDSTSVASNYASGYSSGYQRALEMVKWKIDNELRSK